jgi:hypothetical protein
MTHQPHDHTEPDQSIDRTLAALRTAAPPEGMEARITERLAARGVPHSSRPRGMGGFIASLLPQSLWLRGAITGAALASLAFATFLVAGHLAQTHSPKAANLNSSEANIDSPALKGRGFSRAVSATAADGTLVPEGASPCAPSQGPAHGAPIILSAARPRVPHSSRGLLRDEWEEGRTSASAAHLIPASFAPSHPAPPAPLTAQERALVQLVRTATPAELAALNPAAQQKADAEREAAFQKFFAPSPERVALDESQGVNINPDKATSPQPTPPQPAEVQN